jgi:hypothetical protein
MVVPLLVVLLVLVVVIIIIILLVRIRDAGNRALSLRASSQSKVSAGNRLPENSGIRSSWEYGNGGAVVLVVVVVVVG